MADDVDPRLQRLLDHEDIRQAMYRYARGVDRRDAALISSVYHPDAWDDHGNWRGDRAFLVEYLSQSSPPAGVEVVGSQHHLGNIFIVVVDDEADVESSFIATQRRTENGRVYTRMRAGRYLDRFERRDGVWGIARRRVVEDWSRLDEVVATPVEVGTDNTYCRRDRADASYRLPLIDALSSG